MNEVYIQLYNQRADSKQKFDIDDWGPEGPTLLIFLVNEIGD
jgi:hypothetical protein